MTKYFFTFALLISSFSTLSGENKTIKLDEGVHAFIQTYCIECHNDKKQKGDRRFDELSTVFNGERVIELSSHIRMTELTEILDVLNLGEMPPDKKNVKQPSSEERRKTVEWITNLLTEQAKHNSSQTVMRRLNHYQYLNTIRDLLAINTSVFDPTGSFPDDETSHGFDNIGQTLNYSDVLLNEQVKVAKQFLDKASFFKSRPKPKNYTFTKNHFRASKVLTRSAITWRFNAQDSLEIGHGNSLAEQVTSPVINNDGVPEDGYYEIKIKATAANRLTHPYNNKDVPADLTRPMKMGVFAANGHGGFKHSSAKLRKLLKTFELSDNKAEEYSLKVWLNKGDVIGFNWYNGPGSSKPYIRRIAAKYHKEVMDNYNRAEKVHLEKNKSIVIRGKTIGEVFDGPRLRFYGMSITGPIYPDWPPMSHQSLFGKQTDINKIQVEQTLKSFAAKAFKRPIGDEDLIPQNNLYKKMIDQGKSKEEAIKIALTSILVSPEFVFISEGKNNDLTSYQLASRLSYFLWGSIPDSELRKAAANGKLGSPQDIGIQVKRMLNSHKVTGFVNHFSERWLELYKLGLMPPSTSKFKIYYKESLEEAMKQETRLFFRHILDNNRPVSDFIDSDYTFVNDGLAKLYEIPNVTGQHFRKVQLSPAMNRGGLLGQASILTASANGIDTSPVIRGIWVLENILGTTPAPPPPDVEPIEPDTRGTTTIREQLVKHRQVEACADCHAKIDPLGFALEFYDPIGQFRTKYKNSKKLVDGHGKLPSGESFKNHRDLKKILMNNKDQFTKALTEKLLTYATGRMMTFSDREEMDRIVQTVIAKGYGLNDLITEIACSSIFTKK